MKISATGNSTPVSIVQTTIEVMPQTTSYAFFARFILSKVVSTATSLPKKVVVLVAASSLPAVNAYRYGGTMHAVWHNSFWALTEDQQEVHESIFFSYWMVAGAGLLGLYAGYQMGKVRYCDRRED